MVVVASELMDENRLPPEILAKKKAGANLTSTTLQVLRERATLLVQILRTEPPVSTVQVPYPFSSSVRDWAISTLGILIDRLGDCLQGGSADAVMVVHFFLSDRLLQLNPLVGPMAAALVSPMID